MNHRAITAGIALAGLAALGFSSRPGPRRATAVSRADPRLDVLIVGGGPSPEYNQVAIESNVRYLQRILPRSAPRTVLFADGDPSHATVEYDSGAAPTAGAQVLDLLLDNGSLDPGVKWRAPRLGGRLDGPSKQADVDAAMQRLGAEAASSPGAEALIYFTGHGSPNRRDKDNNVYDLWGGGGLSVRHLALDIRQIPQSTPVTLVMVQCFSGAFANLLFENGDPSGAPLSRGLAGFFATVKERVAAGCTSAVDEADYHDFTSYFFAALSGRDRVGRAVTGADYDGDGRVEMDEAFCYALSHDDSIDIPVCTSDVFLRRFEPDANTSLFSRPYSTVLGWASPAQRGALMELSSLLGISGDDRASRVYRDLSNTGFGADESNASRREENAGAQYKAVRSDARQELFRRYPSLQASPSAARRAEEVVAAKAISADAGKAPWADLLSAESRWVDAQNAEEREEIAVAHQIRFVRLFKSVVLGHLLEQKGDSTIRARYERLIADEHQPLLPTASRAVFAGERLQPGPRPQAGACPCPPSPGER